MVLNGLEIKQRKLLRRTEDEHFKAASYDLTIGNIITMKGKVLEEYVIPPRGMVLIVTKEVFDLKSKNILGYTTVKNAQSTKGLLAINVGLIDPEWVNPISSAIINFGKNDIRIKKDDEILRVTFQETTSYTKSELSKIININNESDEEIYKKYLDLRVSQSMSFFSTTFLSIDKIKNEVYLKFISSAFKSVFYIAALVAILSFTIPYINQILFSKTTFYKADVKKEKVDSLEIKIKQLEKIIENKK